MGSVNIGLQGGGVFTWSNLDERGKWYVWTTWMKGVNGMFGQTDLH